MGEGAELILMALGLPAGAAILIGLLRHAPNLRETATLAAAAGLFWMVWRLAGLVGLLRERPPGVTTEERSVSRTAGPMRCACCTTEISAPLCVMRQI